MNKRIGLCALATLGLMIGTAAQAEVAPGFYAGVGIGNSKLDFEDEELGIDFDADDTGFKIFGGYNFNQYFGVEAAYVNGGQPTDDVFGVDVEFELTGFIGSVVGRVPVGDTFALFGKVGFASYDVEVSALGESEDESESDMAYGFGGALTFAERWEVRVEYEAIDVSDGDFNMISLSGLYRF